MMKPMHMASMVRVMMINTKARRLFIWVFLAGD
jgi:hypothetical protein